MKTTTTISSFARYGRHLRHTSLGVALVGAVLASLYLFEGVMAPGGAKTVEAWHCVSMTATPSELLSGEASTLSWNFESDTGVTVTIDHLPGQVWQGTSGSVKVSPTVTTTYVATAHKVDTSTTYSCSVTVSVIPVPKPPVTPPACPFTADAGTTVVTFDNKKIRSDGTLEDALASRDLTFAPGTYTVRSASWDGYPARVDHTQPHEEWYVEFLAGGTVVAATPPTNDLRDYVEEDMKVETLTSKLVLSMTTNKIVAHHNAFRDTACCNDVVPICVAVTKHEEPNDPWCSVNLAPTAIVRGATSTLSWNSRDMASVTFDQGIGTVATTGNRTVSPSTTTRYTGTFTDRAGGTHTCAATLTVTDATGPTCTMSVSPTSVVGSGDVTLTWASTNATSASLDQGIGSVALSGSRTFTVSSSVTYTGTFTAGDGRTAICTASVTRSTGGGSCLNCDSKKKKTTTEEDDPSPVIVLSQAIKNVGGYVTLDQVPYTGFEAGPFATFLFWLGVLVVSAFIAHLVTIVRPMQRLYAMVAGKSGSSSDTTSWGSVEALSSSEGTTSEEITSMSPHASVRTEEGSGTANRTDDGMGVIEETAHRQNILLSPEAARRIMAAVTNSTTPTEELLTSLFERAKEAYPHEDGWILLSHERAQELLMRMSTTNNAAGKTISNVSRATTPGAEQSTGHTATTSRSLHAGPSTGVHEHVSQGTGTSRVPTSVPTPRIQPQTAALPTVSRDGASASVVSAPAREVGAPSARMSTNEKDGGTVVMRRFVENVVQGKRQEAHEMLRVLSGQGVSLNAFVASVVRKLDDVYRHRIEGNHSPDRELAAATALWSNVDFEVVLGILVECTDYSYTNDRIGAKVALAKLFDHFGTKEK